jgi:hypothetical protein
MCRADRLGTDVVLLQQVDRHSRYPQRGLLRRLLGVCLELAEQDESLAQFEQTRKEAAVTQPRER